jgi:hypothetical protein
VLKLLPSRSKVEKDWVAHANGSEPERSLSLSRIFVSPTNSPSSLGTLPVSALLSSRRSDRVVSNRISAGIGPAKPVFWDLNLVTSPELHVTLLEEHAAPMAPPESVSIVFHVVSAAVNMDLMHPPCPVAADRFRPGVAGRVWLPQRGRPSQAGA